jgi:hypothetical protein
MASFNASDDDEWEENDEDWVDEWEEEEWCLESANLVNASSLFECEKGFMRSSSPFV